MGEIHNDLIKAPSKGDFSGSRSESVEVITRDTSLRKYMPPQVLKIINHHKVMCGCET